MFQLLTNVMSYVQFSEKLRWVLLAIATILSALLIEIILKNGDWLFQLVQRLKQQKWIREPKCLRRWTDKRTQLVKGIMKCLGYTFICLIVLIANFAITLLLLYRILHFEPQQGSLCVLFSEIWETQKADLVIPIITSLFAGWVFHGKNQKEKSINYIFCAILILSTTLSSFMYFLNTFNMMDHHQYSVPIESISSIMNSRLNIYPFALSGDILKEIGDGSGLFPNSSEVSSETTGTQEEIKEPTDFSGYIAAISDNRYAPGMSKEDYLFKAYALFSAGKHNDDYFHIGVMWHFMYLCYDDFSWIQNDLSITKQICINEALAAYLKSEELSGGNPALYSNIALIYHIMNDRAATRKYLNIALSSDGSKDFALSTYTSFIYGWVDDEEGEVLLTDAATILKHEKNLSMYILYGAYAAALNTDIENAYNLLEDADTYFYGQSAMVKILKCICADLAGIDIDDSAELQAVYNLEDKNNFTTFDSIYLMRYLFVTNRYEELEGYIADVGTTEDAEDLDVQKAAMKATWYSKNPDKAYSDTEGVESLLKKVEDKLADDPQEDEKKNLLLSQMLLRNCLDKPITSDIDEVKSDGSSDLQYVFLAIDAFNAHEYASAIEYCDAFFKATKNQKETDPDDLLSLQRLEPQEQISLNYYMQLVYADSHLCYAKYNCLKGSKAWKEHMEIAETECNVFERSTKSLYKIRMQFQELKNSIDVENGKIPEQLDEMTQ